ncbi:hypothetical protein GMO_02540 [Gluconobacter morbifer G707]|uniref:Uncharacterized protein n=1 Tax=Gluconobacter morbifer G707 TaxID=1088869 RepID=G6XFI9_9PROT|nr:hypothetical protein GMO_02540 [Gluconobacter morbifer G707]
MFAIFPFKRVVVDPGHESSPLKNRDVVTLSTVGRPDRFPCGSGFSRRKVFEKAGIFS